jgi:hypothetical protein
MRQTPRVPFSGAFTDADRPARSLGRSSVSVLSQVAVGDLLEFIEPVEQSPTLDDPVFELVVMPERLPRVPIGQVHLVAGIIDHERPQLRIGKQCPV